VFNLQAGRRNVVCSDDGLANSGRIGQIWLVLLFSLRCDLSEGEVGGSKTILTKRENATCDKRSSVERVFNLQAERRDVAWSDERLANLARFWPIRPKLASAVVTSYVRLQ